MRGLVEALKCLRDALGGLLGGEVHSGGEHGGPGWEVVLDLSERHVRLAGYLAHGRLGESALLHHSPEGADDRLTALSMVDLPRHLGLHPFRVMCNNTGDL